MSEAEYQPRRPRRRESVLLRGLAHCVHRWGEAGGPLLVWLHGWMDTGATFQLTADHLPDHWDVVAPDWRGFGDSARAPDGYWFPDYLADLDALLAHYAGDRPVHLAGHSMGGNVACLYAGVRPERIERLVSVEGFGLPAVEPEEAPRRYRDWLLALEQSPDERHFPGAEALASYLRAQSPGLAAGPARFIARCWTRPARQGVVLRGDPRHRRPNPVVYRLAEAMACWRRISAPVLWVRGAESRYARTLTQGADWPQRLACFTELRQAEIPGSGHSVHHECPVELAAELQGFIGGG